MSKLVILNGSGDESIPFSLEDHKAAMEKFASIMGQHGGTRAFALDKEGKSKSIGNFDPTAEEVLIVGQFVGG